VDTPLSLDSARRFAAEWIEAWNSHDLERILSHYADDFEMHSPFIVERMGEASGMLKGKQRIRPYWEKGPADGTLRFTLQEVLAGVNSIAVRYRRHTGNSAVEVLFFEGGGGGPDHKIIRGVAHYGHELRLH
jgi:ketosteroid isomerase-like protein